MKMKRNIILLFIVALLFACNDNYLEKFPQTDITEKNFFQNVGDLQTYSYQFYDYLGASYWDRPSDNTTVEKGGMANLLLGTVNADNIGAWGWGRLRSINYFLDRYQNATGNATDINKYGAMGRFARANFYTDKVKTYSDVPWYSHTIGNEDVAQLYKACDTRELVVDSIIADLEFATKNLTDEKSKTLFSKWVAYTELARFCLYEGTYRKYHKGETDLHVTKQPEYFLNKAVEAANAVMQSGKFSIYKTGKPQVDYSDLFNGGTDLSVNSEIIMFSDYEDDKREHGAELVLDFENGVSRTMADSYLDINGNFVPKSVTDVTPLETVFVNRDPRMKQSLFYPGFMLANATAPTKFSIPKTGGYGQIKFLPKEKAKHYEGYATVYTDLPLYRYAEVLLTYAEAKAELGTITQGDLDKTVNAIRDRVGVGHLNMSPAIDPVWASQNPGITSSQKAELLEIRRERRVELFAEGFRYGDMMRWKLGKIFEEAQQGIYVPPTGLVDLTGDGVADYFISDSQSNKPSPLPAGITVMITTSDACPIYLENGKSGHIMFKNEKNGVGNFIEPKFYYRPISTSQILLNPNLKQLFGWNN
jgi:starch-binding outer membrane protein, SusD/RagB family